MGKTNFGSKYRHICLSTGYICLSIEYDICYSVICNSEFVYHAVLNFNVKKIKLNNIG